MKELLEKILKQIVDNPKDIEVEEVTSDDDETFVTLMIYANEEDKGLIIGKGGATISALRDIIRIKAIKENKKVRLEIAEE